MDYGYASYPATETPKYGYGVGSYASPDTQFSYSNNLYLNGYRLNDNEVEMLRKASPQGGPVTDGNFWYDRRTGCWGVDGSPTAGWIMPGLLIGGELQPNASRGNTNIFMNNREMHEQETAALRARGVYLTPSNKYYMDAMGRIMDQRGKLINQAFANPLAAHLQGLLNASTGEVAQGLPVQASITNTFLDPAPFNAPPPFVSAPSGSFGMPSQTEPSQGGASFMSDSQFMYEMSRIGGGGASAPAPGPAPAQMGGAPTPGSQAPAPSFSQALSQIQMPTKLSDIKNPGGLVDQFMTQFNTYGKQWGSDLVHTFFQGYVDKMKKKDKNSWKTKLLENGLKYFQTYFDGNTTDVASKSIDGDFGGSGIEGDITNMLDFSGTGLDQPLVT